MQHLIVCAQCSRHQFGTVETCTNLELMCPRCRCTTLVDTHGDKFTMRIGRMPESLVRRLMWSEGVDERKCR